MALQRQKVTRPKQVCPICKGALLEPHFADTKTLEKFLTDRGKIVGRKRTDLCSKHQKRLGKAIKRARFLALLPFVEKVV